MLGVPSASVVKTLPANAGDTGSIPGSGSFPAEGNGDLLQCSCLGSPKDRRSPAGHSPRGHRRVRHTLGTKSRQQFSLTAGQRNRRESTEINPHAHDQLTVKEARRLNTEKRSLFGKWCCRGRTVMQISEIRTLPHTRHHDQKLNWLKDLNMRHDTIKCPEEATGKALSDINFTSILLG